VVLLTGLLVTVVDLEITSAAVGNLRAVVLLIVAHTVSGRIKVSLDETPKG
jgi:hypothetical protein